MMKTYSLTLLFLTIILSSATAQNLTDALRYSILDQGGTARVIGAGSAFGAMGGDIGVTGTNVSGLADFRKNEVTVSVSYNNPKTTSSFAGQNVGNSTQGRNFQIDNIAFVKHVQPAYGAFVTSNWMVGFQQYASFGETYSYNATHPGSLVERLAEDVNFGGYNLYEGQLAIDADAIYYLEELDFYVHDFSDITYEEDPNGNLIAIGADNISNEPVQKEEVIERSGNINELQLAWAGRMKSGLRMGLAIGIPWVSYEENKFYEENATVDSQSAFNKLNFNKNLTTSGIGFNLKAGIGYTILKKARLGLSVQSPTFFRMDDLWFNSMLYDCDVCQQQQLQESDASTFDYKLRTPMKLTGSIGALMGQSKLKGFLNLDVHYIDYGSNRFNFTYNSDFPEDALYEAEENANISNQLASGFSFNLGGEVAYDKYRIRAGVTSQLKPFRNELGQDYILAAGLGYRAPWFYADLAIQASSREEGYVPYLADTEEKDLFIRNEVTRTRVILTLGFKI